MTEYENAINRLRTNYHATRLTHDVMVNPNDLYAVIYRQQGDETVESEEDKFENFFVAHVELNSGETVETFADKVDQTTTIITDDDYEYLEEQSRDLIRNGITAQDSNGLPTSLAVSVVTWELSD